jgi:protein-L-isoaspartate(D-aspartate) O-methyltransferase
VSGNPADGTAEDRRAEREAMVRHQLRVRGVSDERVLEAMASVPRERFVPHGLAEFAYADTPLPIESGQTISQPYIVAVMAEALELEPDSRVLEIGAGSGYAAAILSRLAGEVYTIERHEDLARLAADRLRRVGYDNVVVRHGDGRLGWPEKAPFDAIVVTAGGETVPQPLLEQLAIGGRLVIPVGEAWRGMALTRITRTSETEYDQEDLGPVQFVPLLPGTVGTPAGVTSDDALAHAIAAAAEPVASIDRVDLAAILERIGDARLVLIGEASHGTSEFYRMRQRITAELLEQRGFSFVAAEADWPDAAVVDAYVRRGPGAPDRPRQVFSRFPTWMWRNAEVLEFVEWLRRHNDERAERGHARAAFYGLDLYSMYASIGEVLRFLDQVDPDAARVARQRYACLSPFEADPASYGLAAITERYRDCEEEVVTALRELRDRAGHYLTGSGDAFLNAEQNARVAANAEAYYRAMYYGSAESWNLRDRHMMETLEAVLTFHGPQARGVIWAHNSHVGDARYTEMAARGELNLGQLVREAYGEAAYIIGFGTDHGTVAAASDWDRPMEIKNLRPARPGSYERLCHEASPSAFLLPLHREAAVRDGLAKPRLERAIGVIYRPDTELASHYFQAILPSQFDEYAWFDETHAITPLAGPPQEPALEHDHPFAPLIG